MKYITTERHQLNFDQLIKYTQSRSQRLDSIKNRAIACYSGPIGQLSSAIGMLYLTDQTGWRAMYILHTKSTIRRYEKILGISIREEYEEYGPLRNRSRGYLAVQKLSNFWKAVNHEVAVKDKNHID